LQKSSVMQECSLPLVCTHESNTREEDEKWEAVLVFDRTAVPDAECEADAGS